MLRNWGWVHWTVLSGYYAAAFILSCGSIFLALVLIFLPILAISFVGHSIYTKMTDYLSINNPQVLGRITSELYFVWQSPFRVFSLDAEIEDPYYKELRNHFRKILRAQAFSAYASIIIFIYNLVTVVW